MFLPLFARLFMKKYQNVAYLLRPRCLPLVYLYFKSTFVWHPLETRFCGLLPFYRKKKNSTFLTATYIGNIFMWN